MTIDTPPCTSKLVRTVLGMTNKNKNELKTSQDFVITVAQILRGVFDGSIHQSEIKLELTSANDLNAFLLSFRPTTSD